MTNSCPPWNQHWFKKKGGMSRNQKIQQIRESPELITRRAQSVLYASRVSTNGILSASLQLGAKLLLSRAAVLCPDVVESWRKEL